VSKICRGESSCTATAIILIVVLLNSIQSDCIDLLRGHKDLPTWKGETHHAKESPLGDTHSLNLTRSHAHAHPSVLWDKLIMSGTRPAPSHHASTICEVSPGKFMAAWFGGTFEGKPDVAIYTSTFTRRSGWSKPEEVVTPHGVPTWNPVLFKLRNGQVLLFYKVGRSPITWHGFLKRSDDGGATWGAPELLPNRVVGPAKNKPLELADGTLLCPSSVEKPGRDKEWSCYVEATRDGGLTWERRGPIELDGRIIQPALFLDRKQNVHMVIRTRKHYMAVSSSDQRGKEWSRPRLTAIPCPNTGLDVVRLKDGRLLLVYNHSFKQGVAGRGILAIALSADDGETWLKVLTLEDSAGRLYEYSYPAVIQAENGDVHITYTWRRHNIKHIILNPDLLQLPAWPTDPTAL